MTYADHINQLTRQYNDAIHGLEDSFHAELLQSPGWNLTSSHLKRQYSKRYQALEREYRRKRNDILKSYQQANPEWAKWRRIWGWVFVVGIVMAVASCIGALPVEEASPVASAMGDAEERYWNADNIPIPHLQDATQYVSNPDNVLTQGAVDRMNLTLRRLDTELGVESVVIVVGHIDGDDPFRMAQDVGNKYGVGRQDRGLVVVVGYLDHSINMSPGRALEADLTDAECHRLEQQYVVPAMRAEQPDSGMIYLVEAVYSTLQKKELPQMAHLTSQSDEVDDEIATIMGIFLLGLVGWCVFFLHLNRKYQWLGLIGSVSLMPNPFYVAESSGFSGGFGGGGGSFGGGGGGSFGGGSFGGGGATSRW